MIAYNKTWLSNLEVHRQLDEAYRYQCLSREELDNAKTNYPVGFYTPNFFVRIGLFILTAVIVLFSFGLFSLLFLENSGERGFGTLLIFFALFAYAALEMLIRQRHHYRSGVDDALLWMSGIFMVIGLNLLIDSMSSLGNAVLIFLIACYLMLRFVDMLMSVVTVLAMAGILFYTYIELGSVAKNTMPFMLMIFFALLYFFTKRRTFPYYSNCLLAAQTVALVCFYLAGNYFIVREAGNELLGLGLAEGEELPLGWLFWIFTVIVPVFYIYWGIHEKDTILLRVGLFLVAVTVITVCYYYQVLSLEAIMCMSGLLLIGVAYAFIRYLRQPKKGFTYQELNEPSILDKLQVESLVVTQTFGQPATGTTHTKFGGGAGGGGGATGSF
jgi:hypothetical protein